MQRGASGRRGAGPSAARSIRAAARVTRSFLPGLEYREHRLVGRAGELGHRVGAHRVRLVTREEVALLINEGFPRTEVYGAVSLINAAGGLFVFETLHPDRVEWVAFDLLPIGLLENREAVESGPLEAGQELLLGESAHQ